MHGRKLVGLVIWSLGCLPTGALGYDLEVHAFPSVGGFSAGNGYLLGATGGLPVAGTSSSAGVEAIVGFWISSEPHVVSADEPPLLEPPAVSALNGIHPNPFAAGTTLRFQIGRHARAGHPVRVEIFDVSGRSVRVLVNDARPPGQYATQWDGTDTRRQRISSGVYFARLSAGNVTETTRLVVTQ